MEKNKYVLGGLFFLGFAGFIFFRSTKPRKSSPNTHLIDNRKHTNDSHQHDIFTLGSMSFNLEARKLYANGTTLELTKTEARVLGIFALSPNETIERNRLQKEIWEDEGVIVGRSLDMFISKLRKKLEIDPCLKIVVIRGKGYKLEISTEEMS